MTGRFFLILGRSVLAFLFELGALALGYYAYLSWTGASITGSLLGDLLLPVSLVMLYALNIAVVSRWYGKDTDEPSASDTPATGGTKKEQGNSLRDLNRSRFLCFRDGEGDFNPNLLV